MLAWPGVLLMVSITVLEDQSHKDLLQSQVQSPEADLSTRELGATGC